MMIASGLTGTDMRPRPCREARSVSLRLEPAPHRQAVDDRRRDALAAKERVFDFRETQLQRIIFILGLFEPPLQLGNHIAHRYTCADPVQHNRLADCPLRWRTRERGRALPS